MGLVDYGSDSDSDASSPPTPVPSATAKPTSSSSTSLLDLPAPKSSLNLPAPAATTSKNGSLSSKPSLPLPKKKEKGPVRIMLDLPAAQPDGHDEPAKKKPKLTLGSRTGLTGLAAMLPTPKNEVAPVPPVSKAVSTKPAPEGGAGLGDMFGTGQGDGTTQATDKVSMFAPPSVRGKGKAKATLPPPAVEEPAVDFFGIGSVTASSSSLSSAASSKPTVSSAPTISSAPSLRERSASTPKQPSADDPYPGFTQLPSGEWVAKDQKTYEMALEWQQQQLRQQEREAQPKGFDDKEIANTGGYKDVDEAQRAKEAWATRPSQLPGKEEEFKKSTQIKGIPKQASQQARRKGQLSSLIAEAHDNRAELEERIAQARSNRKSAGNKYGF